MPKSKKITLKSLEEAQESVDLQAEKIKDDPTRPRYHAICPAYWMNDPNGPILYKDEIHLFYQHHPFGPRWNTMHWGHMKTNDLIHWENLPIAFGPSFEAGENHCYSGCCVVGPDGRPTALYTSIGDRMPEHWIAIGSEDTLKWEKYEGNPVMDMEIHAESGLIIGDWRDPYAWKGEDGLYYCVIGGHQVDAKFPDGRNPSGFLYTSKDLRTWKFLNVLTSRYIENEQATLHEGVDVGKNWECPNFFKINESEDEWLMMVSPHSGVTYAVGKFINNIFEPKIWHNFDHSGVFYAPNSLTDHKGRNIVIGWIRMNFYEEWNGCFSLPRVVHLNEDGETITALPIPEIKELRGPHAKIGDIIVEPGKNLNLLENPEIEHLKDYFKEKSVEILLKINSKNSLQEIPSFYCELFGSTDLVVDGAFGYDNEDKRFYIGKNSGILKLVENEEALDIRLYVDRSVIEIFINDRWAITQSVKLTPDLKLGLEIYAESERITIESLDMWGMNPIN